MRLKRLAKTSLFFVLNNVYKILGELIINKIIKTDAAYTIQTVLLPLSVYKGAYRVCLTNESGIKSGFNIQTY